MRHRSLTHLTARTARPRRRRRGASAAPSPGAVVFSNRRRSKGVAKGGLFAVRDGHLNQLTEDPTDTEPAFSPTAARSPSSAAATSTRSVPTAPASGG